MATVSIIGKLKNLVLFNSFALYRILVKVKPFEFTTGQSPSNEQNLIINYPH